MLFDFNQTKPVVFKFIGNGFYRAALAAACIAVKQNVVARASF